MGDIADMMFDHWLDDVTDEEFIKEFCPELFRHKTTPSDIRKADSSNLYWQTEDGKVVSLKNMTNNHLLNTIAFLDRRMKRFSKLDTETNRLFLEKMKEEADDRKLYYPDKSRAVPFKKADKKRQGVVGRLRSLFK